MDLLIGGFQKPVLGSGVVRSVICSAVCRGRVAGECETPRRRCSFLAGSVASKYCVIRGRVPPGGRPMFRGVPGDGPSVG